MSERMLTAQEAGERLGISARKVYALASAGELACHRFGAAVRFDPADLDEYKKTCRSPATTRAAGSTNLTASLKDSASALTSYFQKARRGKKPSSSTSARRNGSGALQLVQTSQNR
jgi:excisionase family DNA binding protein